MKENYQSTTTTTTNNNNGVDILGDLGRRITQRADDHRESAFLLQRLSVLNQRYNEVAVLGTFARGRNVAVPA